MPKSKHPPERYKGSRKTRGCAMAIFLFAACSFSVAAENEILQQVATCFNKGPYATKAEAQAAADDAEAKKGYTASVTKKASGWMVRICHN